MLRRFLLALCTVVFNSFQLPNIYMCIYASLYIISIYIKQRPMISKFVNWCEISNEMFILLSGYFMLMFTEWIWDLELRYALGQVFAYLLVTMIIINLFLIARDVCIGIQKQRIKREKERLMRHALR